MWKDINGGKGLASILDATKKLGKDNRSKTSAANGKLGGRPREMEEFLSLQNEDWRPTLNYKSYFVSNLGRVVSCKYGEPRIMKTYINDKGYQSLDLSCNNVKKTHFIHVLVLEAFCGARPTPKHHSSHIDGNPLNSHLSNLVWESAKENEYRKKLHGTSPAGEGNAAAILKWDQVEKIREEYFSSVDWNQLDLAKKYGVSKSTICGIIKGRNWNSKDGIKEDYSKDQKTSIRKGSSHRYATLTEEQVREIKIIGKPKGVTYWDIAKKYGSTDGAIRGILRGTTWKHVAAT